MCVGHCFEKTLYYTSPGHGGWGIIRVAAMIPQSHLLFICPSACFRHGALGAIQHRYKDRTSYLYITPEDVVAGYDEVIIEGAEELLEDTMPRVLFLFVSCLDDFIGTDMDAVAQEIERKHPGLIVRACHMNPVAMDTTRPPLITTFRSMLTAIPKEYAAQKARDAAVNLLGCFAPVSPECELFDFMRFHGINEVRQLADYDSFEDYCCMASSKWNLIVAPSARFGAEYMDDVFGTQTLDSLISYDLSEIEQNYRHLEQMMGVEHPYDFTKVIQQVKQEIEITREALNGLPVVVSDSAVLRPFALAKVLSDYGFCIQEVIAQDVIKPDQSAYDALCRKNSKLVVRQPQHYRAAIRGKRDTRMLAIGYEGAYLRQCDYVVDLSGDEGMYGFYGVIRLMKMLREAILEKADLRRMIEDYGAVV